MSKEIDKVEVTDTKVKFVVVDRKGTVQKRQQMTFDRRQFEVALRNAKMTVPWYRVLLP